MHNVGRNRRAATQEQRILKPDEEIFVEVVRPHVRLEQATPICLTEQSIISCTIHRTSTGAGTVESTAGSALLCQMNGCRWFEYLMQHDELYNVFLRQVPRNEACLMFAQILHRLRFNQLCKGVHQTSTKTARACNLQSNKGCPLWIRRKTISRKRHSWKNACSLGSSSFSQNGLSNGTRSTYIPASVHTTKSHHGTSKRAISPMTWQQ